MNIIIAMTGFVRFIFVLATKRKNAALLPSSPGGTRTYPSTVVVLTEIKYRVLDTGRYLLKSIFENYEIHQLWVRLIE